MDSGPAPRGASRNDGGCCATLVPSLEPTPAMCSAASGGACGRHASIASLEGTHMSLGMILVIILIIFLLGGFSGRFGGYGYGMGHSGMGLGGLILVVLLVLLLLGKL
jgi:Protein of unknown function (DUF3309)